MKCVSFNVNSLRMRLHQLQAVIDRHRPEVIGLQETKVQDEEYPEAAIAEMGYHSVFTGQKTHYGVALLTRTPLSHPFTAFEGAADDAQKRVVGGVMTAADGTEITLINGYFPQGESRDHPVKFPNKARFYADLKQHLQDHCDPGGAVIVTGDMNVAPLDLDIGIGEDNRKRWLKTGKCSFLPEERTWLDELVQWGLRDTFRARHADAEGHYSWFDYRSRGFEREPKRGLRIDFILATAPLLARLDDAGIDLEVRAMDKPSDHCPVWAKFR